MSDLQVARSVALYLLVMIVTFVVSVVWEGWWWVAWVGWTPFFLFVAFGFSKTVGAEIVNSARYLISGKTREERFEGDSNEQ